MACLDAKCHLKTQNILLKANIPLHIVYNTRGAFSDKNNYLTNCSQIFALVARDMLEFSIYERACFASQLRL